MPVVEKICLGVNLGTCEKYGEGEQPYDWAIAAGMYTPELDNNGATVACGCGGDTNLWASTAGGGNKDTDVTETVKKVSSPQTNRRRTVVTSKSSPKRRLPEDKPTPTPPTPSPC